MKYSKFIINYIALKNVDQKSEAERSNIRKKLVFNQKHKKSLG